ncbi:MAG: hypothetical protein MK538_12860 [Planctomycetes bacterium]|nr:hypothetical protein [Planctomycetota bacterium]
MLNGSVSRSAASASVADGNGSDADSLDRGCPYRRWGSSAPLRRLDGGSRGGCDRRAMLGWHHPVVVRVFVGVLVLLTASGCALSRYRLDVAAVSEARQGLKDSDSRYDDESDVYYYDELEDEDEYLQDEASAPGFGSVFVGELIAIFPGMFWQGLGHRYAGDKRTGSRLQRLGQFGLLMTAIGGGAFAGGYYLDQKDVDLFGSSLTDPVAYSLYGTGAIAAVIGLTYYFTAWGYGIVDTPRAVRSGGRPPEGSSFIDSLDFFD